MARAATALFLLLSLTATPASAGCAWVLWELHGLVWTPVAAFTGEHECKAERTARFAVPGMVSNWYSWNCFPDTIDPRGPKKP